MNKMMYILCLMIAWGLVACGGEDGDPNAWLYGDWLKEPVALYSSDVVVFDQNGTWTQYEDYLKTDSRYEGTWSISGSEITLTGEGTGTYAYQKISDTQFSISSGEGSQMYYKKDAYVLNQGIESATSLSTASNWVATNLSAGEVKWFYFDAVAGTGYRVHWDDETMGSGTYTCDVEGSAYNEDFSIQFFEDVNAGYNLAQPLTNQQSGKVYVYFKGNSPSDNGTFAVCVSTIE